MAPLIPCPIDPLSQQDLLDLLERIFPPHWLEPIKDPGPGYEALQAYAAQFARISQAVEHLGCDSQISTASSGSYATGRVILYRDVPNTSFDNPTGQAGVAASIVAGAAAGRMRVTGLAGMTPASVGRWLNIQAANSAANNGSFQIAAYNDATSLDVFNPGAVIPDSNNGAIVWQEVGRDVIVRAGTIVKSSTGGQTFVTTDDARFLASSISGGAVLTGQVGSAASTTSGAAAGQLRITGLTGMTPASVGRYLSITGAGSKANIGRFPIAAYNSATSVDITNGAGVQPDANNGALAWQEELPDVGIKATSVGYEWNVPGEVVAADGEVLPGDIDTVDVLVEDPALGDPTIKVRQVLPTSGGRDAALDALGLDRGIARLSGEDDDTYRNRVRGLPDTISPDAMQRTIQAALGPVNLGYQFIETWEITYQTCYDAPPSPIPGTLYNPSLFVYDDPDLDATPFRNRWMDDTDYRGGVIVVVENAQPMRDLGMLYDDTAANVAGLVSSNTGGLRSPCAYDVPSNFGFGVPQGAYDGFDPDKQAIYKGLYDSLQRAKAGGVSVAVELRGQ